MWELAVEPDDQADSLVAVQVRQCAHDRPDGTPFAVGHGVLPLQAADAEEPVAVRPLGALGVDAASPVEIAGVGEAGELGEAGQAGVLAMHLPGAVRAPAVLVNAFIDLVCDLVPVGGC